MSQKSYYISITILYIFSKRSINVDTFTPQLFLRNLNLSHQLLMSFRYIIECENAPPKLKEEVGAQGHQSPEGELERSVSEYIKKY